VKFKINTPSAIETPSSAKNHSHNHIKKAAYNIKHKFKKKIYIYI